MIQCQVCGSKSNAPLCNRHVAELKATLIALTGEYHPNGKSTSGWLESLADAATGQTRMGGDNGRRERSDSEAPLRFNDKASGLMVSVRGTLARIVLDLCETRGVEYRPVRFVRPDFVGPLQVDTLRGLRYADNGAHLALWLLIYIDAIVASEDAGQFFDELANVVAAIKAMIDRPEPLKFFGVCPAILDDDQRRRLRASGQEDRKMCSTELKGKAEDIETQCHTCKRVYNAERILRDTISEHAEKHFTQAELIGYQEGSARIPGFMDKIGERVPERTFQRWRKDGKLKPRAWRRPNGRRWGFAQRSEDDEPEFKLIDVLRLRDLDSLAT